MLSLGESLGENELPNTFDSEDANIHLVLYIPSPLNQLYCSPLSKVLPIYPDPNTFVALRLDSRGLRVEGGFPEQQLSAALRVERLVDRLKFVDGEVQK